MIAGKYRLERLLKQGGMGAVWIATHLGLDERVAVKFMDPRRVSSAEARIRFTREAKAAAQIRSKNIVQILDHGVDNNVPYIAMELLAGEDLAARLRRVGRLSVVEASALLGHIAHALDRAHAAGIVHRDLKPENIFLAKDGDHEIPKILDFGIALEVQEDASDDSAATQEGVILGTPYFMSPEQVRGRANVDHRSDLWSVGVILFRAITGIRPFGRGAPADVIVQICSDPIPRASVVARDLPDEVDRFFEKALARDVARRFSSAKEMAAAFGAIARLAVTAEKAQHDPGAAAGGDDRTSDSRAAGNGDRTSDMRLVGDRTSDMRLVGDRTSETRTAAPGEGTSETRRMRLRTARAERGGGSGTRGGQPPAPENAAALHEVSKTLPAPGMTPRGAPEPQGEAAEAGAPAGSGEVTAPGSDTAGPRAEGAHPGAARTAGEGLSSGAGWDSPEVSLSGASTNGAAPVAGAGVDAAVATAASVTTGPGAASRPAPDTAAAPASVDAAAATAASVAAMATPRAATTPPPSAVSRPTPASGLTPASARTPGSGLTPASGMTPASGSVTLTSGLGPAPAATPAPGSVTPAPVVELSGAPSSGSVVVPSLASAERRSRGVWIALAGAAVVAGILGFVLRNQLFAPPPPPTQPSVATTIVLTAGTVVLVGPGGERIPVMASPQPSAVATASAAIEPEPSATAAPPAPAPQIAASTEPASTGAPIAPSADPPPASPSPAATDPAAKPSKPAASPADPKPAPKPAADPYPVADPKPASPKPATKPDRDLGY